MFLLINVLVDFFITDYRVYNYIIFHIQINLIMIISIISLVDNNCAFLINMGQDDEILLLT